MDPNAGDVDYEYQGDAAHSFLSMKASSDERGKLGLKQGTKMSTSTDGNVYRISTAPFRTVRYHVGKCLKQSTVGTAMTCRLETAQFGYDNR